ILQQFDNDGRRTDLKRGFSKHRLARQKWFGNLSRHRCCPLVVLVVAVDESDYEAGICNCFHREKPFRLERSRGPLIFPACRMKDSSLCSLRALSSCSRISLPTGIPVRRDSSVNQSSRSGGMRTVSIVLLICP